MILAGPYTHAEADELSREAMREIVFARGGTWVDGMGEPPGKQQGPGPRNLPGQGYATHASDLLPSAADPSLYYIRVTSEMAALSSRVRVPRTGVELDPDVVLKR